MAYRMPLIAVALLAGLGMLATAQPVTPPARYPGSDAWGEVRVTPERMPAAEFTIAPSGTELTFFGYNRAYHVYDLTTGKIIREVPTEVSVHDASYSPDGKVLATAEWFAGIHLRDAKSGRILQTLKPEGNLGAFYATYLRDDQLAAHCWRSETGAGSRMHEQLAVWDKTMSERIGWAMTSRLETNGQMIRRRFAGFGRHLLSIKTQRKDGYVVSRSATLTEPLTNKESRSVPLDMDDDFVFDVSPDGRTLLVFNIHRPPRLVDVATGTTIRLLRGHRQYVTCGAFSPDGKLIATASGTTRRTNLAPASPPPQDAPTEIILWDRATGQRAATLEDKTTRHDYSKIAFSPDGKFIVAMTAAESPGEGQRRGGQLILWGKLPGAASTGAARPDELRQLREELNRQKAEIARLRAEVDRLNKLVPAAPKASGMKRPPPPTPGRFRDRGDHVEDTKSGLLWQKDGDASGKLNYYDAIKYAASLELGGQAGWRVPTKEELAEIFPAVDAPFADTKYNESAYGKGTGEWNSYWTITVDPRRPDYAYVYQWYASGGANNCIASKNFAYVRCVHGPVTK